MHTVAINISGKNSFVQKWPITTLDLKYNENVLKSNFKSNLSQFLSEQLYQAFIHKHLIILYFETAASLWHRQKPGKMPEIFKKQTFSQSFVFIPYEKAFSHLILVPRNGRAALTSDVPDVTLMRAELSLVCGLTAIKLSER